MSGPFVSVFAINCNVVHSILFGCLIHADILLISSQQ